MGEGYQRGPRSGVCGARGASGSTERVPAISTAIPQLVHTERTICVSKAAEVSVYPRGFLVEADGGGHHTVVVWLDTGRGSIRGCVRQSVRWCRSLVFVAGYVVLREEFTQKTEAARVWNGNTRRDPRTPRAVRRPREHGPPSAPFRRSAALRRVR